ncbi:response regulator [Variovorax sp. J22P168]|uniref:response regulator n=1 Tax=Variovorax jilinensis TaxID=3053513 RepID=UPI0025781448|nr:response regulator [Variovorax sp. J22P168]MDM0015445.1 response regulator [Variovorax sp. J22P168]
MATSPADLLVRAIDVIELASHHIFSELEAVNFQSPTELMALSDDEQQQVRETEDQNFKSRPAISAVNFCLRSAISLLAVAHTLTDPPHAMTPQEREEDWKKLGLHTKLAGRAAYRASLILCDPIAGTVRGGPAERPVMAAQPPALALPTGDVAKDAKVRVMVVDDDSVVALLLQHTLGRLGYQVIGPAATSDQAIDLARETQPDLVLMDINLGAGGDGIQAAASIAKLRRVPVVFLTAYSEDAVLGRARGSGAYGYLLKPFTERGLHATIQMALERWRSDTVLSDSELRLRRALYGAREPSPAHATRPPVLAG